MQALLVQRFEDHVHALVAAGQEVDTDSLRERVTALLEAPPEPAPAVTPEDAELQNLKVVMGLQH